MQLLLRKAIKQNFEWLQQFDKIILWFDNDEPGRKAAQEAADALPPGKAYLASTDAYKDASDALQANDYDAITQAFWNARSYRPDGIVDGKSLLTLVTTPNPPAIMTTRTLGYNVFSTESDMENLLPSLLGVVSESHLSAGNLRLVFYKRENGSVILLLKNRTDALPLA